MQFYLYFWVCICWKVYIYKFGLSEFLLTKYFFYLLSMGYITHSAQKQGHYAIKAEGKSHIHGRWSQILIGSNRLPPLFAVRRPLSPSDAVQSQFASFSFRDGREEKKQQSNTPQIPRSWRMVTVAESALWLFDLLSQSSLSAPCPWDYINLLKHLTVKMVF